MTPGNIFDALTARGWQAEIVRSDRVPDLVFVEPTGLFKCVDGRHSNNREMRGPKALGGVYAIAATRGVTDLPGLAKITEEVCQKGFVPSVHGDDCADPPSMGCGFFKLWCNGDLPKVALPEYSSVEGQETVLKAGGVYEQLSGKHQESVVMINLVPGTTLEPMPNQRFVVDAWVTAVFNLDVPTYLTLAAETVERLNGPRRAIIIVAG